MPPDPAQYLSDIEQACDELLHLGRRQPLDAFLTDIVLQRAAERGFSIIGEAVAALLRLGVPLERTVPECRQIVALRNRLSHVYWQTDPRILWGIIQEDIPSLRQRVQGLVQQLAPTEVTPVRPRIVITGMGWITPLGHDLETVWARLLQGHCGIERIRHFDASTFPTTFAAQVKDYDWRRYVRDPAGHRMVGTHTAFALGAAAQAWKSAGLDRFPGLDRERLGIYLGAGEGVPDFDNYVAANLAGWDAANRRLDAAAWVRAAAAGLSVDREAGQEPNMPLAHLALEFDARGPAYNCLTACAASTQAIGEAAEILRRGDADVMITGGTHTMVHPLGVTGFNRLTALSRRNDDPLHASRPFDRSRDGFVMGEGSGMVILETLDHARRRGAAVLAEIVGYGSSADAFRITDIPDDGHGAVSSMRQALADAGLTPADIHYISAHGTGTKENDSTETLAVKTVFGEHARSVPMSSVKSMLGHLIAAAGAVELITCVLAIRDRVLPPTMNLTDPDPACDMDYVPNAARQARCDVCLSNSFGFGGQNDTLIVRRCA